MGEHPPSQTSATTVRRDVIHDVWDTWGASCSLNPPGGYGSGRYGCLALGGGSTNIDSARPSPRARLTRRPKCKNKPLDSPRQRRSMQCAGVHDGQWADKRIPRMHAARSTASCEHLEHKSQVMATRALRATRAHTREHHVQPQRHSLHACKAPPLPQRALRKYCSVNKEV